MEIGHEGGRAIDSLLAKIMKPLSAYIDIEGCSQSSEYQDNDEEPSLAEASRATPRPMHQPDKEEGHRGSQTGSRKIYGGDLQFWRAISTVSGKLRRVGRAESARVAE